MDNLTELSKQLEADVEDHNAKLMQSLDVPPSLDDKRQDLFKTKSKLEYSLVSFDQQQLILNELDKNLDDMLTEKQTELELKESEDFLSETRAVHLQNLSRMDSTKKLLLEAINQHNASLRDFSQKIKMLRSKYEDLGSNFQDIGFALKDEISPQDLGTAKQRILSLLKRAEDERQLTEERAARLKSLHRLVAQADLGVESERESQGKLNTLKEKVSRLQLLSGVKCTLIDDRTVNVHFVDSDSQKLPDWSKLVVTLSFTVNENQCLELSAVDTNIKVPEMETIIHNAKKETDLPRLIRSLRILWLSQVPLMAEISSLRESHAIDWKSEDRTLHLIVDKCIVCRLCVPRSYPHGGGSVTLEQVMGAANGVTQKNIPPPGDVSLTGWVKHLEKTFTKS